MEVEVEAIRKALHQRINVEGEPPIFKTKLFRKFCKENGAHQFFDSLLKSMTEKRHSETKRRKNTVFAMEIIYKLCFGKSQKCNVFQKQHGIYLKMNHVSQEGIETEKTIGNTVCTKTLSNELRKLSVKNEDVVKAIAQKAIENKSLIVLIIDDYTTVHTKHRPKTNTSTAAKMWTIICRVFPQIQAIPLTTPQNLHNPSGIDIKLLKKTITNQKSMSKISKTFANCMPDWKKSHFFDPEFERNRLQAHMYRENDNLRKRRSLENLYLVDFFELELKSRQNFDKALTVASKTLKNYMEKFVVLVPGDWPAQFYIRQVVYSSCRFREFDKNEDSCYVKQCHTNVDEAHNHIPCQSNETSYSQNASRPKDSKQSAVPLIGPLHIALNAKENIMHIFHEFFKYVYESLFPGSKLADKPKPWRTAFLLELVYGGWTLNRDKIRKVFKFCKEPLYGIFLNLLDNYLPLSLSMYSVSFRLCNFAEYFDGMIAIWIMFYCFRRHHYDKAPLVWLSNILYWQKNNPALLDVLKEYLSVTDEYPVVLIQS